MIPSESGGDRSPHDEQATSTFRRVVLLGFMASGKTAVGRELAESLGWKFVDLDEVIERRASRSIHEIFATEGEARFREMEADVTPEFTNQTELVIAPGGGWVTNSGLFDSLPPDTLTVWLQVSPAEVVKRVGAEPGQAVRPLLSGGDPHKRIESLLSERTPLYSRASLAVDTVGRSVHEIVEELKRTVRSPRLSGNQGNS